MIVGHITGDREAIIRFPLRIASGAEREIQAVIDTGFNGYLTLPEPLIRKLNLPYHSRTTVMLGDGSSRALSQYEAIVV